jgi:D-alanine-D-alanine ligase
MPPRQSVLVLHNHIDPKAGPDDLDTLVAVESVRENLTNIGYEAQPLEFSSDLRPFIDTLLTVKPAFVFNLVELHENSELLHLAPEILEHLHIAYTGCSARSIMLTNNKVLAKKLMLGSNIPTPRWYSPEMLREGQIIVASRYIVKTLGEHASVCLDSSSVVMAEDAEGLRREIESREQKFGKPFFAEEYIDGREFNLALLGSSSECRAYPVAEITFDDFPTGMPKIIDYKAKWEHDSFEYTHTNRNYSFRASEQPMLDTLVRVAKRCWREFQLNGYARVDFRVDHQGRPYVLEVNANPCISPDSGLIAAAERAGQTCLDVTRIICQNLIQPL